MAWRPTWPEYGAPTVKNDMTKNHALQFGYLAKDGGGRPNRTYCRS
jgi:hypothetical protein